MRRTLIYRGAGSRKTPEEVCCLFVEMAGGFTDLDSFKNKVYSFAEEQIRKMRKL